MASQILAMTSILLLSTSGYALLQPQTDTWNSSFRLTSEQIAKANISSATAHNLEVALNYERTNNAGSLVPIMHSGIRKGDFVDVAATMKIVVTQRGERMESMITLQPHEVYVYKASAELRVRSHLDEKAEGTLTL